VDGGRTRSPGRIAAARGAKWSSLGLGGRYVVRIALSVWLARLLGPKDFGIASQALLLIAFLSLFYDQGMGSALVQRRELQPVEIGTAVWINVGFSALLGLVAFFGAPLGAAFFRTPQIEPILHVLSVLLVLQGLTVVPMALLNRALRFRAIAAIELAAAVAGGACALVSVSLGAGYWALVVNALATQGCAVVLALSLSRAPTLRASRAAARELWSFGANVMGFTAFNYAVRNVDNFLIGRYLGSTQLALYALSYRTMLAPLEVLGQVVNRVALPMYSRIQDEPARMRRQFLDSVRLISLFCFPALGLVVVAAPVAVPWIFGREWHAAIIPMQLLAIAGIRQATLYPVGPVLIAAGRPRWLFWWGVVSGTLSAAVFGTVIALGLGIVGMAAAVTVYGYVVTPLPLAMLARVIGLEPGQFARALAPSAAGLVVLLAVGAATSKLLVQVGAPDALVLFGTVALGTAAFAGAIRARPRIDVSRLLPLPVWLSPGARARARG
jgi:PST family polysaccharide transporter